MKCQNLKTQEVVAVKVVKNRTAYFNQSMMEVSVLDLVRSFRTLSPNLTNTLPAQYEARQERRPSSPPIERHFHSSTTSLLSVRTTQRQSLRTDQAKSVPRSEHDACASICSTTLERPQLAEQGSPHTLRLEAGKHLA